MKRRLIWIALLSVIFLTNTTELQADKLGELRVSENGRFLIRKDGSGFFPLADTAWEKLGTATILVPNRIGIGFVIDY
jgi:hypothetical protein